MIVPLVAVFILYLSWSVSANEYGQTDLDFYKTPYEGDVDKRAGYIYKTSQGKRLPVYDFGLGKRDAGGKLYSFGLGKRDFYEMEDDLDDQSELEKRVKPYGFGLGKRLAPAPYNFGLGKRRNDKLYSFGLGKRSYDYDDDNVGYYQDDRRANNMYKVGLGKRDISKDLLDLIRREEMNDRPARSMHYNFGLGKRSGSENAASLASAHSRR